MTTETLAALGPPSMFQELGKGGEGQVFAIPNRPLHVYKQYLQTAATAPGQGALQALIDLKSTMSVNEQQWLSERTIWPELIVVDKGQMRGFLMRKISPEYFQQQGIRSSPRSVLCEWNLLAMRERYLKNSNIVSSVPNIEPFDALRLVLDLAKTVALLHKFRVVVGDMSGRNLLWTDNPTWRVLIIDCDSLRIDGSSGVASPKQSPDWDDPHLNGAATTQSSDIYKLGLAAYRGIWAATTDRPNSSTQLRCPSSIPEDVVDLVHRSIAASNRPTAEEWVSRLQPSIAFGGRPVVNINKNGASTNQTPVTTRPAVSSLPSKQRPVIKMNEPPANPMP